MFVHLHHTLQNIYHCIQIQYIKPKQDKNFNSDYTKRHLSILSEETEIFSSPRILKIIFVKAHLSPNTAGAEASTVDTAVGGTRRRRFCSGTRRRRIRQQPAATRMPQQLSLLINLKSKRPSRQRSLEIFSSKQRNLKIYYFIKNLDISIILNM